VDRLKEATPVGAWLLSMLFLAIEEIGCEIEDPCVLCTRH
jgi:predicted membrane chloride channel (bestrophin family)